MADAKEQQSVKKIDSTGEHEDYSGQTLVTSDHDVIRQWAEERDAGPATVSGSEYDGRPGRLLLDFPGGRGEDLVHIDWNDWFGTFDERKLEFHFQEHKSDGDTSNFFKLVNPSND